MNPPGRPGPWSGDRLGGSFGLTDRAWLRGALVALLVLLGLSPSLTADFAWDDRRFILESATVGDLGALPGYFVRNMQESYGAEGAAAEGVDLYRPLYFSLLGVEHRLAGGARPLLFHATSLALHLAVVLLLLALGRRWLGRDGWRPEACALLFGLHPVTGAAPLWISAQSELLMAAALLGAILLLDREADHSIAAAGVFALGLLSKEVLLLALPAVSLWLVRGRGVPIRRLVPVWTAAVAFFVLRLVVLGGVRGGGPHDPVALARNAPLLVADGLRGLLLARPVGLRHLGFEYAGIGPGWWLVSALVAVCLVALGWLLRRRAPLLTLGIAVLLSMLAPVVVVTTVPGWGGFGRYLYVPWMFVVLGLVQVAGRRGWLPVAAALLALQATSLPRALHDWRDDEALGASQVRNRPDLGVGHGWLGQVDLDRGDFAAAAEHYQRAIEVDPSYHPASQNLAICMIQLGRARDAIAALDRHDRLHGRGPRSSFARGLALAQLGDVEGAARVAVEALERAPGHADLLWLMENLRHHHPDRPAFEAWLSGLLASHPRAGEALSASSPDAPPGSGSGTSAPASRSTGSP